MWKSVVDYHAVFDVPLANGKKVKLLRVDVGCFLLIAEGRVYFKPNEAWEYGAGESGALNNLGGTTTGAW